MSSYERCTEIELRGYQELQPFLEKHVAVKGHVLTNKGKLAKDLQATYGDFFYNNKLGEIQSVELKTEVDHTGNFFMEVWSNRTHGHQKPGWMVTLQKTSLLWYYFLSTKDLYWMEFPTLFSWAWERGNGGRISDPEFELKPQNKYDQLNSTWGRIVPIDVIRREVGLHHFRVRGDKFEFLSRYQKDPGARPVEEAKALFK